MFRDRTEVSSGDYHFTKTTDNLEFKSFTYLLEEEGEGGEYSYIPLGIRCQFIAGYNSPAPIFTMAG